jgi:predicted nucleic acid-binding protein
LDRVFLDANVLFSAAYHAESGLARLWDREGVQLVTAEYAVEEARRNLRANDATGWMCSWPPSSR